MISMYRMDYTKIIDKPRMRIPMIIRYMMDDWLYIMVAVVVVPIISIMNSTISERRGTRS